MEPSEDMNNEASRLSTFNHWPSNAVVEPSRIAAAGFYSTGPGLSVKCYCCGCEITEWDYSDQVMARHRFISPECAFVRDPQMAGNVPLIPAVYRAPVQPNRSVRQTLVGSWVSNNTHYKSEQARLDSFVDWPVPYIVRPEALAATGFYFLRQGDKVQCAFCTGVISHWEAGDVPKEEHKRHFPACPFVVGIPVGNIPRVHTSFDSLHDLVRLEDIGAQAHRGPRHPKYSTVDSRLNTFVNWPAGHCQRPTDLAQAGLFHVISGSSEPGQDQVRCFHCDGGLRNWEPEDVPWREHARWFPKCPFLVLVKGKSFIEEVQKQYHGEEGDVSGTTAPQAGPSNSSSDEAPSARRSSNLSTSLPTLSRGDEAAQLNEPCSFPEYLEEENRRLRDARQCKICMDDEIGTVLLPCGHLVACVRCAPSLLDCPLCRVTIKATVRTYLT